MKSRCELNAHTYFVYSLKGLLANLFLLRNLFGRGVRASRPSLLFFIYYFLFCEQREQLTNGNL